MPSASQFLGAIATPIGTLVKMPDSVTVDTFTDNSGTYLRCGVLIPRVSPDHDTLVSLGLSHSKWVTAPNDSAVAPSSGAPAMASLNETNATSVPNKAGKLFALGVWGSLRLVAPGLWVFSGARSTVGQATPVMISEPPSVQFPPPSGTMAGGIEARSAPCYSSELSCWVIFETRTGSTASSVPLSNQGVFYTSVDGSTWLMSNSFAHNMSIHTGIAVTTACAGAIIHILGSNQASAAVASAFKLAPDRRTVIAATGTSLAATTSRAYAVLYAIGPDSVIAAYATANNTTAEHAHSDGTVTAISLGFSAWSGGTPAQAPMVDRNDTQVLIFGSNNAQVVTLPLSNNRLTTNTVAGPYATPGTTSWFYETAVLWTGSYWVFSGRDGAASTYFGAFSTNAVTWTVPTVAAASNYLDYLKTATICKTGMHDGAGGAGRYYNFSTASGVTGLLSIPGRASATELPVEFNSALITANTGSTITRTLSTGESEIVYYSLAAGSSFGTACYIKIVNGRAFVVNISNNILVHSADGITWTSVTIAAVGAIKDVEFIGSNWVVVATAATNNVAYSNNLTAWTGVTIGSSIGNGYQFVKGAAYLIATSANGVRRTTDGVTWTTPTTGSPATWPASNTSVFNDGTTSYLNSYVSGATYNQYASTDGNTWVLTTPPCLTPGAAPVDFRVFNGLVYCRASTGRSQVYVSATVGNFATSPTLNPTAQAGNYSALYVRNNALRYRYLVPGVSPQLILETVVDAVGAGTLVGYDRSLVSNGEVSYVRIK